MRLACYVLLCTISFYLRPLHGQRSEATDQSFAAKIVASILADAELSTAFDGEVLEIAHRYSLGTRFAGKVLLNKPSRASFLNLYVVRLTRSFFGESYIRNNCVSFAREAIVVCDEAVLDAVPGSFPLLLADASVDEVPPSALRHWLLGHEIGHVVLGHDNSYRPSAGRSNADSADFSDWVYEQELAADRFAVSAFPVRRDADWIYFGQPFVDHALWFLSSGRPMAEWADRPLGDTMRVKTDFARHPPMAVRAILLVQSLRRVYSDFPFGRVFVPDIEFVFEHASVQHADNALPFNGFYLGENQQSAQRSAGELDIAAWRILSKEPHSQYGVSPAICHSSAAGSALLVLQHTLVCGAASAEAINATLTECATSSDDESFRCASAALLVLLSCDVKVSQLSLPAHACEAATAARRSLEQLGTELSLPRAENAQLLDWGILAQYLYLREVLGWNLGAGILVAEVLHRADLGALTGLGAVLGELHLDHLRSIPKMRDSTEFALLSQIGERFRRLGNTSEQARFARQMIKLLSRRSNTDLLALGYARLMLSEALRDNGVYIFGRNQARDELGSERREVGGSANRESTKQRGGREALMAAEHYALYFRKITSRRAPRLERLHAWRSHLNSLGAAVFAFNVAGATLAASSTSDTLLARLELHQDLTANDTSFTLKVLAPAFENISLAYLADSTRDARRSVELARQALLIRQRHGQDATLAAMNLSFSLYKAGARNEAKELMQEVVRQTEQNTMRRFSLDGGFMVSGKLVTFGEILR